MKCAVRQGLSVVLACCLAWLCTVSGEGTKQDENGVYDFREDAAFDAAIEGRRVLAVMFHDPHISASESVLYEYRHSIKQLQEEEVDIGFGVVDISNANTRGLMRRFAIFNVPTFLVFHEGTPHQYYSNFTRVGITEALREHAGPEWKAEQDENVVAELTDATFDQFIKSRRAVMMMFYAPWCNHCKQMMPMYHETASQMLKNEPAVPFGRIDGSAYTDVTNRYNVSGFPTLYLFRNGVEKLYDGARAPKSMVDFIKSRIAPASTELKPLRNAAKKFATIARDAALLGIFSSLEVPEFVMFQEVADAFRDDFKSAFMVGEQAMALGKEEFGLTSDSYGFIIVKDQRLPVKKGEQKYAVFDEEVFDMESGRKFVSDSYRSLVNFATQKNWMQRFVSTRPLVLVLTDIDWASTDLIQHEINYLVEVADKFPDVNYAIGDSEDLGNLVKDLGLLDHDEEAVACFLPESDTRFPLAGRFTSKGMIQHIEKVQKGEIKPYLRSQKEPSRNPGPIKVMVASSFEKLANKSRDIVVLFTSQVSKDCQKFEGVLKKVQKDLAEDTVLFFRYDIDNNDVPPSASKVRSGPTLALWRAGTDRADAPVLYEGKRRVDKILEFIRKNAITIPDTTERDEL